MVRGGHCARAFVHGVSGGAILDTAVAADWSGRRVLLTGASGFLGGQVARQALAAGVELHTLGRRPGPTGAIHHQADLTDRAAINAAVDSARPAAVIHCAAPGVAHGSMDFPAMLAVAEGGTDALYAACARLPEPPRVVHVGSGFEFAASDHPIPPDQPPGTEPFSYGAAKAASSAIALRYADRIPLALLRPFHIYGAGEAARRLGPVLIERSVGGESIPLTGCEQQRDFLHVDDCAAFLWYGLTLTGSYNLGSGQPLVLRDYVEAVVAQLARHGIDADCQFGAVPYREGEPMISLPDIARWTAACPRTARVSLNQGVADLVKSELARCA
jgi:nucleoside-diphosphate-sugar epimerase